jgi:hypothetical protein
MLLPDYTMSSEKTANLNVQQDIPIEVNKRVLVAE